MLVTTTSYENIFGDKATLPTRRFDRNSDAWRNYTVRSQMMVNYQDDSDQNLEVDIYPKAVKVINQGSHSNKDDLEKLKAFLDSKLQAQNEVFDKYKETQ